MKETIQSAHRRLASGAISSRKLVEEALARASAPEGEGSRVFTWLDGELARRTADAMDAVRAAGIELSPIAGLPISVKDLFDVQGQVTTAGSPQLRSRPPAAQDALAIARLRRAGAVIIGRTNMTEFAYSGIGLNSHFGTPANPYEREKRRIPGGSTSGGAISVIDGMALATVGSDTGGSVRMPAALSGLTGFKPTQRRIPLKGMFPLSPSLDCVGTMGHTVSCCAIVDAVLAGDAPWYPQAADLRTQLFAIPKNYFLDDMDSHVAKAFESALSRLSKSGARIVEIIIPEMDDMLELYTKGRITPPESYAFHSRLATDITKYDPFVRDSILEGQKIASAAYIDTMNGRRKITRAFNKAHSVYDAILCPTVPIIAPEIRVLEESMEEFRRVHALVVRNPGPVNFLDRCALSIPCHIRGKAPVGLMLIGRHMDDQRLLAISLTVEQILHPKSA